MNVQDAANLTIPEGDVRNIHDKNNQLLWSAVGYDVKYKGDTTQQTYTGKNKMPIQSAALTDDRIKDFVIALPAGTYTYSFDLDSFEVGTNSSFSINSQLYLSTGTYKDNNISGSIDNNTSLGRKSYTFTLDTDAIIDLNHKSNIRIPLTLYNNGARASISNIMIEPGSTATAYEQYVGGIPAPNPDYPQDVNVVKGAQSVKITGKNRILIPSGTKTDNGIIWVRENGNAHGTGTLETQTYSNFVGTATLSLPAGDYTFSIKEALPSPLRVEFTTRDNDNVRRNYSIPAGQTSVTKSFPNGLSWTGIVLVGGTVGQQIDVTIENIQVEPGSTATAYEAYQGQQTFPADLIGKNLFDKNGKITADSWLRNDGSSTSSADGWSVTDYIPILPNTSYATSGMESGPGVNPSRCYYDKDKNFISGIKHNNANPFIDTAPANAYYLKDSFKTDDVNTLQIEAGTTATTYAPYYNYELCKIGDYQDYIFKSSGKNLLNPDVYETGTNIYYPQVGFTFTNTYRSDVACSYDGNKIEISTTVQHGGGAFMSQLLSAGTYYFSATVVAGSNNNAKVSYSILDSNKTVIDQGAYGTTQIGATRDYGWEINVPDTGSYIVISVDTSTAGGGNITISNPQLEKGSTATSYEPYGTDWYVYKETGKVTFSGGASENWDRYVAGEVFRIRVLDMMGQDNQGVTAPLYCDYYTPNAYSVITSSGRPDYGIAARATAANGIAIRNKDCADVTAFKSWLGTHNTTVYYVLATPTYTKITDNTLIGQLNAVHDWLRRYDYYGVVSGNLPIIINRSGII